MTVTTKQLLVFAHRGEAKAFLKYFGANRQPFAVEGFYRCDNLFFLVTGEGGIATSQLLSAVLGAFHSQIATIWHLGIAGTLTTDLPYESIHPVRTFYAANSGDMLFNSFSTAMAEARVDCVSADRRIEDSDSATRLSHFAAIVDREGWYAASAARLFRKQFMSAKLISDDASAPLQQSEIQAAADRWSEALLKWYLDAAMDQQKLRVSEEFFTDDLPEGFYATTAQKRQLRNLMSVIRRRSNQKDLKISAIADIDQILSRTRRPKKRTTLLLASLAAAAEPLKKAYRQQLESSLKPLTQRNIEVIADNNLENPQLEIRYRVASAEDLDRLCEALADFDYQQILDFYQGNPGPKE